MFQDENDVFIIRIIYWKGFLKSFNMGNGFNTSV